MTDVTKQDIEKNKHKGWLKVCSKCKFIIPEKEWNLFKACGQCGNDSWEKKLL